MKLGRVSLATLLLAAPAILYSQNRVGQTGAHFVRGTVEAIRSDQITVAPHSAGAPITIPLEKGWTTTLISPTDESIVAPGNLVNIVEVDQPDGTSRALFVDYLARGNVQPAPATAANRSVSASSGGGAPAPNSEGRAWSQMPGRDEFGAWGTLGRIASVEKTPDGFLVVVQLPDGPHRSHVPRGTVMVRNDPSDQSIVKVGAKVAVIVREGPDGKPIGNRVLVGANGTVPPM